MKRLTTALIAGAAVSTLAYASASALIVDGGTIQAGQDGVTCDQSGVEVNWGLETDDNTVRSVRISEIAIQCQGAELFVKVDGGPTMHKPISSAGQETFALPSPYLTPESIQTVKVWIEG